MHKYKGLDTVKIKYEKISPKLAYIEGHEHKNKPGFFYAVIYVKADHGPKKGKFIIGGITHESKEPMQVHINEIALAKPNYPVKTKNKKTRRVEYIYPFFQEVTDSGRKLINSAEERRQKRAVKLQEQYDKMKGVKV